MCACVFVWAFENKVFSTNYGVLQNGVVRKRGKDDVPEEYDRVDTKSEIV